MSEISSIPEILGTSSSTNPKCPVCSDEAVNIRKLKTHILLKHPKINLCLFCIEKKGWSDTFATTSSYNNHYAAFHDKILQKKEEIREVDKLWKKQERARVNKIAEKLGKPPPKRLRKRLMCQICKPRIEFDSPDAHQRHLLVDHDYDYCEICQTIGPISSIRVHILENHSSENPKNGRFCCYICCGSGPIFLQEIKLSNHLIHKHDFKSASTDIPCENETKVTEYSCFDCDKVRRKQGYPTVPALIDHLKYRHEPNENEKMISMQYKNHYAYLEEKKAGEETQSENSFLKPCRKVVGIINSSGQVFSFPLQGVTANFAGSVFFNFY